LLLEPACPHPENLNGKILNSNNITQYYFKAENAYRVLCSDGYELKPLNETYQHYNSTWYCDEERQWVHNSTCNGKSVTYISKCFI